MLFVQRTLFVSSDKPSRRSSNVSSKNFSIHDEWSCLCATRSNIIPLSRSFHMFYPRYRFAFVPLLLYYCILTFLSQILELKRRWTVFSPSSIFFFTQFQQNDLSNVKKWKNGKELIDSPPPPPSSDDSPRAKSFPDISRWKWRGGWRARATEVCVRGEETSPARSSNVRGMSDA